MDKKAQYLHEMLCKISELRSEADADALFKEYSPLLNDGDDVCFAAITDELRSLCSELIMLRQNTSDSLTDTELSAQQQAEFAEADRVITQNLFNYHFQPIVDARSGEIYAYEALMRPDSDICPSPYHIIKYAEYSDRLNDVERATFLNVLRLIGILDKNYDFFGSRRVFINSIPKTVLSDVDRRNVHDLLSTYSDKVVVEMTEQGELNDDELNEIKKTYNDLNVKIAIDDYGTGYANVQNLLRYMPDYVKIDRSLLNGIHNDQKKRHFVREIINFCHDNGILALTEGIETAEELRTVILLGADLIQGYYTSRPARAVTESIPYEIKQEIIRYHQEREDGIKLHIYAADGNERIALERLSKDGYTSVFIGSDCSDVTLAGTPGTDINIRIETGKDFAGRIILDNVNICSTRNRPCISIGECCDVRLELSGSSKLKNGGIRVPESSRFTCCGGGELAISVDGSCFFGIGNDGESKHGELIFEQGVTIDNESASGVCIGSGLGGKISIKQGRYSLNMRGYMGVGIGAMHADADIDIFASDINMDLTLQNGAAIGSLYGDTAVNITHSSVKLYLSGSEIVGIGNVNGRHSRLSITEANAIFNIVADNCAAIAALRGDTYFEISKASMHITAEGDRALAIGSLDGNTKFCLTNSDSSVKLVTSCDWKDCVGRDDIEINGGRTRFIVNNVEYFYK